MDNPYAAPQSVLEDGVLPMRKKTGWKIMFWCYLAVSIFGVISMLLGEDDTVFDIVGEIVVYSFAFVGIFAFVYNKKIAAPSLWKLVMLVLFGWDYYVFSKLFTDGGSAELHLYVIIGLSVPILTILFFQYFALYQYAFQSKEIWNKP